MKNCINSVKPRILIICLTQNAGGGPVHALQHAIELHAKGYKAVIIARHNSFLHRTLSVHNIPHYTTRAVAAK